MKKTITAHARWVAAHPERVRELKRLWSLTPRGIALRKKHQKKTNAARDLWRIRQRQKRDL